MSTVRRTARAAAVAVGLLAAAAGRAGAQTCTAGTLEDYLAFDFGCQLAGFNLLFDYNPSETDATGSGVATLSDPAAVGVTPFLTTDARGRTTFGFNFTNFAATASVPGGGAGEGDATAQFLFAVLGISSSQGVTRAGLSLTLNAATETPESTELETSAGGFVANPVFPCFADGRDADGPTSLAVSLEDRCLVPSKLIFARYFVGAFAGRGDAPDAQEGAARAELTAVTFSARTVPEPATVVLVAAGLAGVGAATRRRRPA